MAESDYREAVVRTFRFVSALLLLLFGEFCAVAQEPLSDLKVIASGFRGRSSKMPEDVAAAYRAVFLRDDEDAMSELTSDESTTIALKAAWRLAEVRCTERPDRLPLVRFLGFVEGRVTAPVPAWWEACLLASRFDDNRARRLLPGRWPDVDERLFERHTIELGDERLTVPSRAQPELEGDWLLWKEDHLLGRIPRTMLQREDVNSRDWAAITSNGERLYFAIGSDFDGSFGLACLTLDGKELWRAMGWGTGPLRGGVSGPWWASCELKIVGNHVIVFGEAYRGLFIEAFDSRSGAPVFRFCTRYIEEAE
ncbi:MAG TPA: hypothetical protein VJ783_31390 [Pirellulales bacterium]|nr:hypothetical protein [Pirellulales bacterium]